MHVLRKGGDEATPLVWEEGYLGIWVIHLFADVKQRQASVNCVVSQGSTPTTPFRGPSPIGKRISQYSGPSQCQSFSRALWLGRCPYLELFASFCRFPIFCFRDCMVLKQPEQSSLSWARNKGRMRWAGCQGEEEYFRTPGHMTTSEASSVSERPQKLRPLTFGIPFHTMVSPTVK